MTEGLEGRGCIGYSEMQVREAVRLCEATPVSADSSIDPGDTNRGDGCLALERPGSTVPRNQGDGFDRHRSQLESLYKKEAYTKKRRTGIYYMSRGDPTLAWNHRHTVRQQHRLGIRRLELYYLPILPSNKLFVLQRILLPEGIGTLLVPFPA